jgi:hypothetical protein
MAPMPPIGKQYRTRPDRPTRPAPGEPGTLGQQLAAITLYLDAQDDERRTGACAERLWRVCHALATDQPILTYVEGER